MRRRLAWALSTSTRNGVLVLFPGIQMAWQWQRCSTLQAWPAAFGGGVAPRPASHPFLGSHQPLPCSASPRIMPEAFGKRWQSWPGRTTGTSGTTYSLETTTTSRACLPTETSWLKASSASAFLVCMCVRAAGAMVNHMSVHVSAPAFFLHCGTSCWNRLALLPARVCR